jgi:hypothetical protein
MKLTLRGLLVVGTFAALVAALIFFGRPRLDAADSPRAVRGGQMNDDSLVGMLEAMGLEVKREQQRCDFSFKAVHNTQQWELSMSAVLSKDGKWLWIMAWLDELPRAADDVPKTSLLRLLASNDRLGQGMFFAYVAGNRRFVLQRVVPNESISTADCREILTDLGAAVVETYGYWSVANWKASETGSDAATAGENSGGNPALPSGTGRRSPARSAAGSSNVEPRRRN